MADDNFIVAVPVEIVQQATPANPPAGTNLIYPKSDEKFYRLSSAGVEVELGGSSTDLSGWVWAYYNA